MKDKKREAAIDRLVGLVQYYERLLDDMQVAGPFYCEDEEGVLRRWTPPYAISRDGVMR